MFAARERLHRALPADRPGLCEKLPPDALIDGEVIAVDDSGKVCFTRVAAQRFRSKNRNAQHI